MLAHLPRIRLAACLPLAALALCLPAHAETGQRRSPQLSYAQRRALVTAWQQEARHLTRKGLFTPWRQRKLASALRHVAALEGLKLPGWERQGVGGRLVGKACPTHKREQPLLGQAQHATLVADLKRDARNALGHIESGAYRGLRGGKRGLRRLARDLLLVAGWETSRGPRAVPVKPPQLPRPLPTR